MELVINEEDVCLDDKEIPCCFQVDIKRISPLEPMKVALHVDIHEADVHWEVKE